MIHTITGKVRTQGLQFTPEQLEPIGIRPGGTAWGVFVDSANLDARTDFRSAHDKYNNQSVHLVISPLHPDRWLTSFRLQVVMERKTVDVDHPDNWTSVTHGVFDALERLGVNVLDCSKGLLGYDAMSLMAVCEFPDLRVKASRMMEEVDREAVRLAADRPNEKETDRSIALDQQIRALMRKRETVFQEMGSALIQRMALLQAQLLLVNELRYMYQSNPEEFREHLGGPDAGGKLAAMMGPVGEGNRKDPIGLAEEWFLNRRVMELGENPFFVDTPAQWGEGSESGGTPRGDDQKLVFEGLLKLLRSKDREKLRQQKEKTPCPSWFWTRVLDGKKMSNGEDLRVNIIKGVVGRAFTSPVRVSPVPTLGHARVWALPFMTPDTGPDGSGYENCTEFIYEGNILKPTSAKVIRRVGGNGNGNGSGSGSGSGSAMHEDRMVELYRALNKWSRMTNTTDRLDHRGSAVAAVHVVDRYMRVRMVRHCSDSLWATLEIPFATSQASNARSPRGVLAYFVRVLKKEGFRIEDVNLRYDWIHSVGEGGRIVFMIQAITGKAQGLLIHDKLRDWVNDQPAKDDQAERWHSAGIEIRPASCELGVKV